MSSLGMEIRWRMRRIKKIGLAFGGGGARGFAHIGVLKAFEEYGVKFDLCVGTSVGSLVGALYCAGKTADEIYDYGERLDMRDIRSKNLFISASTDGIRKVVEDNVGKVNIENLPTKFCAVATDLVSAREIMLSEGDLATAVSASCCVPQFFKPVVIGDLHLVDGGLLNNIPADVCRMLGADYVVTVDVNPTRYVGTDELGSIAVIKASFSIMMANSSYKGYLNSDVMIKVDTGKFKSYSKNGFDEMYALGYEAGEKAIKEILEKIYF
jgi:NTE family protein